MLKEKDLIHGQEKEMFVQTKFDNGFTIKRGRDIKNNGILLVSNAGGESKVGSQEIINEQLGLCSDDYLNTCHFQQGDIFGFLDATQSKKKEYIARWIEKAQYKQYEAICKEKVKALEIQAASLATKIESNNNNLYDVEELKEKEKQCKMAIKNINGALANCTERKKRNETAYNNLPKVDTLKEKLDEAKTSSIKLDTRRRTATTKQEHLWKLKERYDAMVKTIEQKKKTLNGMPDVSDLVEKVEVKREELNKQIAVLDNEIARLREDLNNVKKFGGTCPFTNEQCDKVDKEKKSQEIIASGKKKKEELDKLKQEFDKESINLQDLKRGCKARDELVTSINGDEREIASAEASLGQLEAVNAEVREIVEEREETEGKIKEFSQKIAEFDDSEHQKYMKLIAEDERSIEDANSELRRVGGELAVIANNLKKNEETLSLLMVLEKQESECTLSLDRWRYLRYMFSPNGIVSYQMENSFKDIENEINYLADKLNLNSYIEFSCLKELQKWEDKCLVCDTPFDKGTKTHVCKVCGEKRQRATKDELAIKIHTAGIVEDFDADSGGGKALIAICFRIAIARMLRRNLGSGCEFLILDEIFGQLDSVNRNLVISLIMNFLQKEMGFSQIFMISHTDDLKNIGSNEIKIVRHEDYSVIREL
jgi:DNA repair exonuclease SbcCD ATPase subunit